MAEPLEVRGFRPTDHKLLIAASALVCWIGLTAACQLVFPDGLQGIYIGLAIAFAIGSFALVRRPYVILLMLLIYLASPAPIILDLPFSAAAAAIMIANCALGAAMTGAMRRPPFLGWMAWTIMGAIAVCMVGYSVLQGNQLQYVVGDLYQLLEFGALFFLTSVVVRSPEQWRLAVYALVGSVVATCMVQFSDALLGADYLPHLAQAGVDVPRTINMNAPIAFMVLLALLVVSSRRRKFLLFWILAVAGNLLLGFTRGVWLATFFSAVFFLFLQERKTRRKMIASALAATLLVSMAAFTGLVITSTNILQVVQQRVLYSVTQFESASDEEELAGRRIIEFLLVGSQVGKHPFIGHGLGSTYEIAGDAVLEGPKGATVDHHYIHNLYLMIAFRLGIPALLVFLWMLWRYLRRAHRVWKSAKLPRNDSAVTAALISVVFGEIFLSFTSPTLFNHPTAAIIGAIMALTLLVSRITPGTLQTAQSSN